MMPCRQASDLAYKAKLGAEIDRAEAEEEWRTNLAEKIGEHWATRDASGLAAEVLADGPCPEILARYLIDQANTGQLPDDLRTGLIDHGAANARAIIDDLFDRKHDLAEIRRKLSWLPFDLVGDLMARILGDDQ